MFSKTPSSQAHPVHFHRIHHCPRNHPHHSNSHLVPADPLLLRNWLQLLRHRRRRPHLPRLRPPRLQRHAHRLRPNERRQPVLPQRPVAAQLHRERPGAWQEHPRPVPVLVPRRREPRGHDAKLLDLQQHVDVRLPRVEWQCVCAL